MQLTEAFFEARVCIVILTILRFVTLQTCEKIIVQYYWRPGNSHSMRSQELWKVQLAYSKTLFNM